MKKTVWLLSVLLIISVIINLASIGIYNRNKNLGSSESREFIEMTLTFDNIYKQLESIDMTKKIQRRDLSTLQEQVAIACHEIKNYSSNSSGLFEKFITLKDIVFKIEDGNNIPDYIFDAINENNLIMYIKRLAETSALFIEEEYGEKGDMQNIKMEDAEKLYNRLVLFERE